MKIISDPLYNDLNKKRDFQTKLVPTIKFNGEHKLTLVDCILKNTNLILKKDRTYDIKVRPHDWPLVRKHWIESINSGQIINPFSNYHKKDLVV